jgi:hypothetical protein
MSDFTEEETRNLAGKTSSNRAEDPTGQFPVPEHYNRENTNTQARGEIRNSLKWAASSEGVAQILAEEYISSIYPYNQVARSITGHVYEVDDTPGNERVLIKHADGAGIELGVDGSVSISALGNRVEVAGGDQHITIVGDAKLVYQGNVDMQVAGEFNIDCNEFNVNVKNNKTEVIGGAETKEVFKGVTNSVVGNVANFVTEQVTDTILGGHQYNVKGNVDYNINGNVGFYASGEMNVTSEDYINLASDNVTASANNMTIQGGSGVIGGTAVDFVGNGAVFDRGVTSTIFTGNLNGKANDAAQADYATTAGQAPLGVAGSPGSTVSTDTPTITTPTSTKVLTYLQKAAGGIRKVKVDIGNYLKDFIDKANRYDGIATQTMTAKAVRSKLRDPANRSNTKFIGSLVEEGTLCEEYNNPTPAAVGRIVDGQSTTIQTSRIADAITSTNNVVFIPRNVVKQFLPDPLYNPLNLGAEGVTSITAKTKLGLNISLSKFLGTEDPVNIKYIRSEDKKKEILKHLFPQATILRQIKTNQNEFEGVTLEVTEGLYRPGNGETITANSINDLKSKGRAVVYKAVDVQGNVNNSRLFDIAVWLKDNAYFDQLILSYDTNECVDGNSILSARLIITMPEIDDTFKGTFTRYVFTEFNGNKLSQGELVEVLAKKPDIASPVDTIVLSDSTEDFGVNLSTDPTLNPQLKRSQYTHPEVTRQAERNLTLLLNENYYVLQQLYGGKLIINDALPTKGTTRKPPSRGGGSQHWSGRAIDISVKGMSKDQKAKLVKAAAEAGFTGFGFGYTILHIDLGPKRVWAYKNDSFAGREVSYWFKWVRQNVSV